MRKHTLTRAESLFVCSILMVVAVSGAGTHQLNVGPREAFYISEDKQYREFTTGLTLGYQYSLLAADMFRLKFGSDNSIDIANGNNKEWNYTTSGFQVFVEPGVELLFYILLPFTARLQIGLSDEFSRSTFSSSNDSILGIRSLSNRFGIYLSPGFFFQTDKGHIGAFTRQRIHTGITSYDEGRIEHSSKMFVWGMQGGFVIGKISHTMLLESSRFVSRLKSSNVWPDWNGIPPERRFSYIIGINIPCVLKMEKLSESTTLQQ